MFSSLLTFEALYHRKQKAFIGFSILFFLMGTLLSSAGGTVANTDFNAPYNISYNTGVSSLGCMFAIMFFAVNAMLRDKAYQMEAIVFGSPISKTNFFWSRFLGTFLFSLLAFSMVLIGYAAGLLMANIDPEKVATFSLMPYLWTFLIIALPNVFICTAIIFSVSAITRNHLATYLSAVFIYTFYWICSFYFNSPILANASPVTSGELALAALFDPFGLAAFFEQTEYWTPLEKNTRFIALSGNFLWNRLLWIAISFALLGISYRLFSFEKSNKKHSKKVKKEKESVVEKQKYKIQKTNQTLQVRVNSFLSLLKIELTNIFKSLPFLAILLIWLVILITEIYTRINQSGAYNDRLYPSTNLMIWLIEEPLTILSVFLIIFYSGEIIHRERSLKFHAIIGATPTSNFLFYASKATALILLPMLLILVGILVGIFFQISKGYYDLELWQYANMFYFDGLFLLFYVFLAFFIQSIVSNKYLGMAICGLLVLLLSSPLSFYIGIEHPLLKLGTMPRVAYTNMAGYGDARYGFKYFATYWNTLGVLLALLSFKLWQRGSVNTFKLNLKRAFSTWQKWEVLSIAFLLPLFIGLGSFIFYNVNIVNEYSSRNEKIDKQADYELKYKQYEHLDRLVLLSMKTEFDVFPTERKFHFKGDFIFENSGEKPIEKVLITARAPLKKFYLEGSKLIKRDSFHDVYLYQFEQPLLPKEQVHCSYEIIKEQKGFKSSTDLIENGSYVRMRKYEPAFVYREGLEIEDNFERKKRGLPAKETKELEDEHLISNQDFIFKKVDFESIISTQSNQIAFTSGDLLRKWTENGRNYYHFKSPVKIMSSVIYVSADYELEEEMYKGISLEHYYHQGHGFNNKRMLESTKITLDYCNEAFGTYPFKQLRMAEIPGHWPFGGQARPGMFAMVENRFYLIDNRNPDGFDLVAKRTIHEVAHQWWGMMLTPKYVEGGILFTEGLTKYTEAAIMDQIYGKKALWQLAETSSKRYFRGRSYTNEKEPPIYYAEGEDYLAYGKSYMVMMGLRELLGETALNAVLRKLMLRHQDDIAPDITTLELLEVLYEATPASLHTLIDDWLKRVITYELKIKDATSKKLPNGEYETTINLVAKRFELNEKGETIPIEIAEAIPLGLFTKHPSEIAKSDTYYLKSHLVQSENQSVTIISDFMPQYVAVDPFGTRVEERRLDNVLEMEN